MTASSPPPATSAVKTSRRSAFPRSARGPSRCCLAFWAAAATGVEARLAGGSASKIPTRTPLQHSKSSTSPTRSRTSIAKAKLASGLVSTATTDQEEENDSNHDHTDKEEAHVEERKKKEDHDGILFHRSLWKINDINNQAKSANQKATTEEQFLQQGENQHHKQGEHQKVLVKSKSTASSKIDIETAGLLQPTVGEQVLLRKAQMVLKEQEYLKSRQQELGTMTMASMLEMAKREPILLAEKVYRDMLTPHPEFTLFKNSDLLHWIVFTALFFAIVLFDNLVLFKTNTVLSLGQAGLYVVGYLGIAMGFLVYIYVFKGRDAAATWFSGYLLEWMLSVDNLFVFRMVFDIYACPDKLKHKPLFYGVMGAIFFRMVFFVVGEALVHTLHFMHLVFGSFLIYTGFRVAAEDDDDDDPTEHPLVVYISRVLPLVNGYDEGGRFFVRVEKMPNGSFVLPEESETVELPLSRGSSSSSTARTTATSPPSSPKVQNLKVYASNWGKSPRSLPEGHVTEWRCTFLFVVVVCLEITDLMFAVDSVSAIVAQVPDLYLAYTACIFAMLGLRATFLIIDELMRLFEYLKYGVAFMLVFIGFKLILSKVFVIPPVMVCAIFTLTVSGCVSLSLWANRQRKSRAPTPALSATGGQTPPLTDRVADISTTTPSVAVTAR
ncbi:unnamed protein product [Amoebophrya sp. A25]|nr:unnamed protein product [Amoebophrya sp. A25]|eukprot:GSA25T00003036001.1